MISLDQSAATYCYDNPHCRGAQQTTITEVHTGKLNFDRPERQQGVKIFSIVREAPRGDEEDHPRKLLLACVRLWQMVDPANLHGERNVILILIHHFLRTQRDRQRLLVTSPCHNIMTIMTQHRPHLSSSGCSGAASYDLARDHKQQMGKCSGACINILSKSFLRKGICLQSLVQSVESMVSWLIPTGLLWLGL